MKQSHSSDASRDPFHQYRLVTGPAICTQAASLSFRRAPAILSASAFPEVVVTTCRYLFFTDNPASLQFMPGNYIFLAGALFITAIATPTATMRRLNTCPMLRLPTTNPRCASGSL